MVKSKLRKSKRRKSKRRKSKSRRRSYKCKHGMLKRPVRDKKTGRMRYSKKGPRKSRRRKSRRRKSRAKGMSGEVQINENIQEVMDYNTDHESVKLVVKEEGNKLQWYEVYNFKDPQEVVSVKISRSYHDLLKLGYGDTPRWTGGVILGTHPDFIGQKVLRKEGDKIVKPSLCWLKSITQYLPSYIVHGNAELRNRVALWFDDEENCKWKYGHISKWILKNVTDMSRLFKGRGWFNQPIGNWDTSKVTTMQEMFNDAFNFNQPIGDWDTSQVRDMTGMFWSASVFNQPINTREVTRNGITYTAWNTSEVMDMSEMFYGCDDFNRPIGNWDTREVFSMENMFRNAKSFNQPLDTNQVTLNGITYNAWTVRVSKLSMSDMFRGSALRRNKALPKWYLDKYPDSYRYPY